MSEMTVLLVDDDPGVIQGLRLALRREKFDVRTASSAEQALRVMAGETIDIVISDQEMPGMKGMDLLARIRETHPETIRFILTGNATLDVALEAINRGAVTRFFVKPCSSHDLATAIREALERRELMRQAARLLRTVKRQEALLDQIERHHPGISTVARSATGAVILPEPARDYETLMRQIRETLGEQAT